MDVRNEHKKPPMTREDPTRTHVVHVLGGSCGGGGGGDDGGGAAVRHVIVASR